MAPADPGDAKLLVRQGHVATMFGQVSPPPEMLTRIADELGVDTGSIAQSADQLFCHRNTLMNRLRRFTDFTSIDVTIPQQAARLVVAWS